MSFWNIDISITFVRTLLFLIGALIICSTQVVAGGATTVVFRYDDYSSGTPANLEVELLNIFTKHHIPLTISVIPYACAVNCEDVAPQALLPLTPAKANVLHQATNDGLVDIALHGYSHQNNNPHKYTEFEGVNYKVQYARMEAGKRFLEQLIGVPITKFVPPWNTYDSNTLAALDALGFVCISAGPAGPVSLTSPLKYLPQTCDIADLKRTIKSAVFFAEKDKIIIVVFHRYDFVEADRERGRLTLSQFEELLDWVTSQPNINVRTLEQALKEVAGLGPDRFVEYSSYRKLVATIPPRFRPSISGAYLSPSNYMKIVGWMLAIAFHLSLLITSCVLLLLGNVMLVAKSRAGALAVRWALLSLLIVVLFRGCYGFTMSADSIYMVTCLTGASAGSWMANYVRGKRIGT